MRYKAEHKQGTNEKVIIAAAAAIRANGPHKMGVADVMAKAGLTHGGFYAHFKSKDDLVIAAIAHMFEEARARLRRYTDTLPAREAMVKYIGFYLSSAHRDSLEKGCPVAALSSDLPRMNATTRECFAKGMRVLAEDFSNLLKQAGSPSPEEDAHSLMAELMGALSISRVEPDEKRADAILADSQRALARRFNLEN